MSVTVLVIDVVVLLGAFIALRKYMKKGESSQPTKEELEALEGAAVLLADESVLLHKVVELTFMDSAVGLMCVADGKSATDLMDHEKFDVVLADVQMPIKNGYEVCEYAKRINPEVPVILLVGAFEAFSDDLYKECGADEVLKKPFDSADLTRITGRLLLRLQGPTGRAD